MSKLPQKTARSTPSVRFRGLLRSELRQPRIPAALSIGGAASLLAMLCLLFSITAIDHSKTKIIRTITRSIWKCNGLETHDALIVMISTRTNQEEGIMRELPIFKEYP